MKYVLSFLLFLCAFAGRAQDQFLRHKVAKSETVTKISQKYNVTPAAIYRLNPDAYNGLKEGQILLIPTGEAATSSTPATPETPATSGSRPATHYVQPGETLFSLARRYGVTVDDLKRANPVLSDGLKSGQILKIPGGTAAATVDEPVRPAPARNVPAMAQTHVVQPGETKFSIAKLYGISVGELEKQNPAIKPALPTGYTLHIVSETRPATDADATPEKPQASGTVVSEQKPAETVEKKTETVRTGFANYEVRQGETLFGLSQQFDITTEQLIAMNPQLKDGVKTGMILKVPGKGNIIVAPESDKPLAVANGKYKDMARRKLVMLLPFNASRITADTTNTTASRLKKDAFLNLTLDFYSGALMAIDSARALGMNFDVRILDSEESKAASAVGTLAGNTDVQQADAIIGPFYQQHAEKLADALSAKNIAVISPMSRELGKRIPNLYQAMPSELTTKKLMLDFLVSKQQNIIVINDPKRASNREFITANYPSIRFLELDSGGLVNADKLKGMLVKGKTNYVILDTEKTGTILGATTALLAENANQTINLVIIEPNDTLDFEEISMKRLTVLKLMYPSMTRENESAASAIFRKEYREKNRIYPSQFAVRGFDVTFDTLMRLASGKSYADSALADRTEQVESQFDYMKDEAGNVNKGIYILQYNDDLTVQSAN